MKAKILWIEGKRVDGPAFIPGLRKKGFLVEIVPSGKAALERIGLAGADMVVINAASLRTSSTRTCQLIREQAGSLPVLMISSAQQRKSKEPCADLVLTLPFTLRKLVNRIAPLLPVEEQNFIQVGPIQFDPESRRVRCEDRDTLLTPRLARLLQLLIDNQGKVVERGFLFSQVWNTTYIEDTRTLDVHVSWLRQAIEADPRKPRYIRTIRGVGYRLNV